MHRTLVLVALLAFSVNAHAEDHRNDPLPVVRGSKAPGFGPVAVVNARSAGRTTYAFDASNAKHKAWLISFFATWCPGCRNEMPMLEALNRDYASRGLEIVTVSVDRGEDAVRAVQAFADAHAVKHPVVHDADSRILQAYQGHSTSLPTLYLVGPDGVVLLMQEGFDSATEGELRHLLDRMLR